MRNPSTEKRDDDLSRLTSSSASLRNQNGSYPGSSLANNTTEFGSSNFPQILDPIEWQKHSRKRKERQDSTSSITQDRKLIRSNSEEYLPYIDYEVVRRVSSHEQIKNTSNENLTETKQHEARKLGTGQYEDDICSLKSTNNEVQEILREAHRRVETSPARSRTFDFSYKLRISPNGNAIRDETDGEPEHRRSRERFCKARAAQPPRKSLASSSKKPPQLARQFSVQTDNENLKDIQTTDNMYKYDSTAMKDERRGFVSKDIRKHERSSMRSTCDDEKYEDLFNNVDNETDDSDFEIKDQKLPWDYSLEDEQPVVSQRFAENKFDHVNNTRAAYVKVRNVLESKTMSVSHFTKEENHKTHDLIKGKPLSNLFTTADEKINQINKRLTSLKRRVAAFEVCFENENGYRPSHTAKLNDPHIKNALAEIHKLRKEKQAIKTDPMKVLNCKPNQNIGNKVLKMKDTIDEIEKRLQTKRFEENRCFNLDELTADQLVQEKAAVQRALLYLESLYGRPNTREERDVARSLYDRYRIIKRLVNRSASISGTGLNNVTELPTILEHEAMAFTVATVSITPPLSDSETVPILTASTASTIGYIESPTETPSLLSSTDSTDTSSSINENVHELSIEELSRTLNLVRDEKRQLGRTIKEFEEVFEEQNGRKMLKTDRGVIEDTYALYKQKKAKLRLLDALVRKHLSK